MATRPKPKRAPSRRIRLSLTEKQFDAITTALIEWEQIEAATASGQREAAHLRQTIDVVLGQADAQAARRGAKGK